MNTKKLCACLYALYVLGAVLQFSETTLLIGLIAMTVAVIIVYAKKSTITDPLYASHFQWLIRTFWIGTGVYLPIAITISTFLILFGTDILTTLSTADLGQIDQYLNDNMTKISLMIGITTVPFTLWWVRRCFIGYRLLQQDKPVTNVMSWL